MRNRRCRVRVQTRDGRARPADDGRAAERVLESRVLRTQRKRQTITMLTQPRLVLITRYGDD